MTLQNGLNHKMNSLPLNVNYDVYFQKKQFVNKPSSRFCRK